MVPPNNLGPDLNGKYVNEPQYRGMIGSLMYLTSSRHDIQFSTCLCARYQENPKESDLIAVKKNFKYLKGTPSLGLWYAKCSSFDLKGYSYSEYVGCNMDKKRTSCSCQLLGDMDKNSSQPSTSTLVVAKMHKEAQQATSGPTSLGVTGEDMMLHQIPQLKLILGNLLLRIYYLNNKLIGLLVNSLKPKISKLLTNHDFSSYIPTKLKELPSKNIDINGAVGEIKKYVDELEVEIPSDLKDLPRKLKEF
nr:uncharacterized mitochondrial protein AtMg00810-like [Tanacetum cinerariifolium]